MRLLAQAELAVEVQKQQQLADVAKEELAIKKQAQQQRDALAARKTAGVLAIGQKIGAGIPIPQAIFSHPEAWMGDAGDLSGAAAIKRSFEPAPAFEPSATTVKHPISGEDIPVFRGGRESAQMIQDRAVPATRMSEVEKAKLGGIVGDLRTAKKELSELQGNVGFMAPGSASLTATQKEIAEKQKEIAGYQSALDAMDQPKATAPAAPGSPAAIKTKAEDDALPSGSTYIGSNGRKYRKP